MRRRDRDGARAGRRTLLVELQRGSEPAHARQAGASASRDGGEAGAPETAQAEALFLAVAGRHRHRDGIIFLSVYIVLPRRRAEIRELLVKVKLVGLF